MVTITHSPGYVTSKQKQVKVSSMCIKEFTVGLKYGSIVHAYKYRKCSKNDVKSVPHIPMWLLRKLNYNCNSQLILQGLLSKKTARSTYYDPIYVSL